MGLTPEMLRLVELQQADQSQWTLSERTKDNIRNVRKAAMAIYGETWNFFSNALAPAAAHVFEASIKWLNESFQTIDYLEIGSCQGLSMSLIASLLRHRANIGRLVSVDPYFAEGYTEGAQGLWEIDRNVPINKTTRDQAFRLYESLGFEVEHIEEVSSVGLRRLMGSGQGFHLIYIDGSHEGMNPLRDLGLSFELIESGGIIMLDDHLWPDVRVIKELCDSHCEKVAESWKVAAYAVTPGLYSA